jgi:signal peptidase II
MTTPTAHPAPGGDKRFAAALLGALAVAAFDQLTKWLVLAVIMDPPRVIPLMPFFNLVLGFNPGVSFGLFDDLGPAGPTILSAGMAAIIAVLLVWLRRSEDRRERLALVLVIGGATGNLVDRLRQGAVTDFLDFYVGEYHWPTFNFADVAISLGVVILILSALVPPGRGKDGEPPNG